MEIDVTVLHLECVEHVLVVMLFVYFLEVCINLLAAQVVIVYLVEDLRVRLIRVQSAVIREELKRKCITACPPQERN